MQALGFIETKGLIVATEGADAMLKAADVRLLEKVYVGGGLVYIAVTGDVGAVQAAVEAGGAAVRKIDQNSLVSQHVIPRPSHELSNMITTVKPELEEIIPEKTTIIVQDEEQDEEQDGIVITDVEEKTHDLDNDLDTKEVVDRLVRESGVPVAIEKLKKLKVVKLRNLAREYKDFGITGRNISKANKNMLLREFENYFKKM